MSLTLEYLEKARQKRENASNLRFSITEKQKGPKPIKHVTTLAAPGTAYKTQSAASPSLTPSKSPASSQMIQRQLDSMRNKYALGPVASSKKKKEEGVKTIAQARTGLVREILASRIRPAKSIVEETLEEESGAEEWLEEDMEKDVEEMEDLEEADSGEDEQVEEQVEEEDEEEDDDDAQVDEGVEKEEQPVKRSRKEENHEFSIFKMISLPFDVISSGLSSLSQSFFGPSKKRELKKEKRDEIQVLDDFRRLKQILESAPVEKRKKILNKFAEFGAVFYLIAKDRPKTIEKIVPIMKELDHMIAGELD